tara:strand:+ start:308 stop:451 length:144 start_codon:yes stop_codon:yes gene_type:complete
MNKKFTSNNIKNDELNFSINDTDYKNLIIRLKEMSNIIYLLEKEIFR